ncbi:beta-ketoacyl synthase N-terminal-like domain-containing protein [Phytohabitans sp. ZYX-F-186]|uniref:Beta-ketoacyl synthase N-terminal-like domain-containing protein n=1 Tax=Phytohabitans maris TaxID=3071409 RepID=A0ABU0ZK40_9ACTN|nr:beta-ketoacyl synthase N-terminal-like domain-containing protein [Phytohabitans sp. ZYX-F-186]MDQ7907413.1 beta-ketoacyl synthase N-terminal-like domain-containing protein [Phytohabitans sp. ZYX-F-186]
MSAVVTGVGVVAPNGADTEAYWSATLAGQSGLRHTGAEVPTRSPIRVAGVARDFAPKRHVPGRLMVATDRWTQLALAATAQALDDSGIDLDAVPEYERGVVLASSSGGNEFGQREIQSLWAQGPRQVTVYQSIAWFYAASTGQVSIRHGFKGPCGNIVAEQTGAIQALQQTGRLLARGARVVLTGGTEAPLSPYAMLCQAQSGWVSRASHPERAYQPFDRGAGGYVPGEGGGVLVVEDAEQARARGARNLYAEVAGLAATTDPPPSSGRPPALRPAIETALAQAGTGPGEVDVVFADAMGVPDLDAQEARTLAAVFGRRAVPVTAPKTMTGRLYAGGAALDLVTAALAIRDGVVPPTVGVVDPAYPDLLDLVSAARPAALRTALVIARGHGGFNACAVLRRVER